MKLADWFGRASATMSPRDLAAKLNVTDEAVRLWLKGERIPRPELMRAIERLTDGKVRPNDFLSEAA